MWAVAAIKILEKGTTVVSYNLNHNSVQKAMRPWSLQSTKFYLGTYIDMLWVVW